MILLNNLSSFNEKNHIFIFNQANFNDLINRHNGSCSIDFCWRNLWRREPCHVRNFKCIKRNLTFWNDFLNASWCCFVFTCISLLLRVWSFYIILMPLVFINWIIPLVKKCMKYSIVYFWYMWYFRRNLHCK